MNLSIIIPAFEEEKRLAKTFIRIVKFFEKKGVQFEIIVINDGSRDNTRAVVLEHSKKYKQIVLIDNKRNRGKGYSVKKGVEKAKGDLILITDADLSTPIEEFEKLNKYICQGYDIVIGSRRIKGSNVRIKQPMYRRVLGRGFGWLAGIIAVKGLKDTQCGFKLFKSNIAKNAFRLQRIDGFTFDVEILFISKKKFAARIKESPIQWIDSPFFSKVNAFKEMFRMFKDLIKIRFLH